MISQLNKKISEKISDGQLKMKPRLFFVAKKFLFIILIIILAIASFSFVNFTFFTLSHGGNLEFLEFGSSGIGAFWENIPYPLIIWALIALILGYLIFKKFDVSYQKPQYFFLTTLGILVTGFVFGIYAYNLNEIVHQHAEALKIPIVNEAYQFARPNNLQQNYGLLAKVIEVKPKYAVARLSNGKILIIGDQKDETSITEVEIKPFEIRGNISPRFDDEYFEEVYQEMLNRHQAIMVYLNKVQLQTGQIIKLVGKKIGDRFYPEQIKTVKNNQIFSD